ncbi:MAG: hypothetical protein ACI4DQ_09025 [Lachnospiraceae bacterium]
MKRKAALVFALCLLILANRPIHAAQPENSLETIKENVEKMNVNPEELAKKAQKLYEEYGSELAEKAQELYEEYGSELMEKALELYEEQKGELVDKAGQLYEDKAGQLTEYAKEGIKKSFLDSVGDFFSDMAASVVDFFKGLFS